jgi:hypothetical protein
MGSIEGIISKGGEKMNVKFRIRTKDADERWQVLCESDNPNAIEYVWTAVITQYDTWTFRMEIKHPRKEWDLIKEKQPAPLTDEGEE